MTNFRTLATETLSRLFARADEYKKRLKSSPGQLDLFGGPRADVQKSVAFEDLHPRAPKGDSVHHGGQFVPKDEAKADVSKPPEDEPAKVTTEPEKQPDPPSNEEPRDEPEIPEEFYDTEFDTGEPVGRAVMVITPWQTGRGFNPSPPRMGPDMNMVEGEIAGFPITTTERGLITRVTKRTQQLLEDAMSDPDVVQSIHDAGITHMRLTPHRQTGFPNHWTMSHSDRGLMFHTRTASAIESSDVPERRAHGIKRVIHHEAGHGLWNNARPEQRQAFADLISSNPDVVSRIGRIVNVKPPRDAWDTDEKMRAADEVHAELHAMKKYDPQQYATFPAAIIKASEDIGSTGRIVSQAIRQRGPIAPAPKWSSLNEDIPMTNDEPAQYAKRPLKSSPGQKDLFGGKTTSGPQKDLLTPAKPKAAAPAGGKTWTAEDEKKHPRGEGGKFTFLNAGTGERSGAVHDALDSHQNMDADMVGMMFNVVHPSQHGDLRKAIDAARPDLSDVTEKHEREHGAMGQKAKMETTELATSPAQWPHEMTIAEYKSRRGDNKESLRFHKSEVKRAISEGKSVPPDVLADYPDLKPTPQPNMVTTEDAAPAQPAANSLPGGKGDKTPEAALPTKEVAKGAKVETEHTSDQAKAKEIAKDHLTEDTGYYDKLADMEKKPKTPPAIPGQQRGLFNETATGQKKLFDFVPPSKAKSAAKPEEKTLADEVQPVKQVESLPGQKSLLDSATAALSKAGLHQGETTPVANVSTSGYSEGQTGTTSAPASSDAKGETMATATTWTPKPNTTKNRLITTGETKAVRDSLKAAGWKWMPLQLSWYLDVDDATADAIRNEETRVDALRKVKGTKKGTITKLEGHVVHQSPTYAPKTQPNTSVSDEYDVDAAGNFAAGARIPGSLDRI